MKEIKRHTTAEVAKIVNRTQQTVRDWCKAGELEVVRFRQRGPFEIRDDSLQAFLERSGMRK